MALAIVYIDGTLVDSNYQHTVAWWRAFKRSGVIVPGWKLHRHIGMGGDQLVATVAGDAVENEHGDAIRDAEAEIYGEMLAEIRPLPGARELLAELRRRGHAVVLASSAKAEEAEHYVDLLEVRELVDGWTTSADIDSTKPAGLPTIGLLCGGFSRDELEGAGAAQVFETPGAACEALDNTALA